eukprot:scaffold299279_cov39-Tisochrysis_lutea.AAC.3
MHERTRKASSDSSSDMPLACILSISWVGVTAKGCSDVDVKRSLARPRMREVAVCGMSDSHDAARARRRGTTVERRELAVGDPSANAEIASRQHAACASCSSDRSRAPETRVSIATTAIGESYLRAQSIGKRGVYGPWNRDSIVHSSSRRSKQTHLMRIK